MIRLACCVALVLPAGPVGSAPAADSEAPAVAMVLHVEGDVFVQHAQEPARHATVMRMLYAADRLRASADGRVTLVFLGDDHLERVKPNAEATVGKTGCAPADSVEKLRSPGADKPALRTGVRTLQGRRGATAVFRSGDLPKTAPAVTPMFGTTVLSDRPSLTWQAADKATGYRVQLTRAGSYRVLWIVQAAQPHLTYPADQEPLTRGRTYLWRVTAIREEAPEEQVIDSKFSVSTEAEAKEVSDLAAFAKSSDPADIALAALAYQAYGLYGEAMILYERLAGIAPASPELLMTLGAYYDRAGRPADATRAWDRARELGME